MNAVIPPNLPFSAKYLSQNSSGFKDVKLNNCGAHQIRTSILDLYSSTHNVISNPKFTDYIRAAIEMVVPYNLQYN